MFSFTLSWMGRLSHCLVSSLHTTKVMPDQTQNACRCDMLIGTKQAAGEGPYFPEKLRGDLLAISHFPHIYIMSVNFKTDAHKVTQMFPPLHHCVKQAILWRKKYILFFKYISIYKDVLALFHYKDKQMSHVSKGNFILTSLCCGFHEVLISFLKKLL